MPEDIFCFDWSLHAGDKTFGLNLGGAEVMEPGSSGPNKLKFLTPIDLTKFFQIRLMFGAHYKFQFFNLVMKSYDK